MAFCPHCGKPTQPGTSFCSACGRSLPATAQPAPGMALDPSAPPPAAAPPPFAPAAPYGATAMPAASVRPVGVTIIGVVAIIMGAGAAMVALAMIFFGVMGAAWMEAFAGSYWPMEVPQSMLLAMMMIGALFVAGFAALAIAAGVGSLQGKEWAWMLTLVVMGLNGLRGLGEIASRDYSGVLTVIISILVIVYYFQPDVKKWFGRPA